MLLFLTEFFSQYESAFGVFQYLTLRGILAAGTALAISLARKAPVTLWARNPGNMQTARTNQMRLPNAPFPDGLTVTGDINQTAQSDTILLAVPMQKLRALLHDNQSLLQGKPLIACCKGIELSTGLGPTAIIKTVHPTADAAILTGPSFAADIAIGRPTALTLACDDDNVGTHLQSLLTTPVPRPALDYAGRLGCHRGPNLGQRANRRRKLFWIDVLCSYMVWPGRRHRLR